MFIELMTSDREFQASSEGSTVGVANTVYNRVTVSIPVCFSSNDEPGL